MHHVTETKGAASLPLAYSIQQLVEITGLSRTLLYLEMRRGTLRARKCGSRTFVLHEDLIVFLRGCRHAG
jgi:hypothetical protein